MTRNRAAWGPAERAAFLESVRLFQRLPERALDTVAEQFTVKRVPRGGFVFHEGDRATSLNLLASGRVKVVRETEEGREVILRQIDPGEIFGGAGGWGAERYPASARAHVSRGLVLAGQGEVDRALADFNAAIRLEPGNPRPYNHRGNLLADRGRGAEALADFSEAIRLDPGYALAWYNLGTVHDGEGDYEKAIELYLKAMALDPRMAEVATNPQVVENRNLMVVKLRHFIEESSNIALPLDKLPE